ncbi:hypothetical protein [Clostridium tarantellae]|uniref:Uncharacterized protein n=1 Tax=Clostridium tarantellae TaxID=39493 RepID=A0A6I1MRM8_9CLOT|nr:hypothetical protein [Clostridium tarantellae]MPQ43551.1 hypothetical protein [Clostridium tarantellae]
MSNFEPNSLVKECIEKSDIPALRNSICTIIYSDRNFSKGDFKNTLNYVVNKCGIKGIYEPFNSEIDSIQLKKDGNYSEDDFAEAVYELEKNFCKERIDFVEKIGRSLYGISMQNVNSKNVIKGEDENNGKKSVVQKNSASTQIKASKDKKNLAIGIGIAVVVIGVAYLIISKINK